MKHTLVILFLLFAVSFCEEKEQLKAAFNYLHTDYIMYFCAICFTSNLFSVCLTNTGYLDIVNLF